MKTVILLVIMATAAWGQRAETCKCPSVADMNAQFLRRIPRPPKPQQAREQRQAKVRHSKDKNHSSNKEAQLKSGDRNGNENR